MLQPETSGGGLSHIKVNDVRQRIGGLLEYVATVTIHDQGDVVEEYALPLEFVTESTEIDELAQTGPALVEAFDQPGSAHAAIDGFLMLGAIRTLEPNLEDQLSQPFEHLDKSGISSLERVLDVDDQDLANKALNLLLSRSADSSPYASIIEFRDYVPRVIALANNDAPSAKKLYEETLDRLTKDISTTNQSSLFGDVMFTLSYGSRELVDDWDQAKGDDTLPQWGRKNLQVMLELENREPGLSRKITDTFKIRNFARYTPGTLHDAYTEYINNPDRPYVLHLMALEESKGRALQNPVNICYVQKALARQGVAFRPYEFKNHREVADIRDTAIEGMDEHGAEIIDIVVDAHGKPNGLYASKYSKLTADNGGLDCFVGIKEACSPNAKIALNACSVGYEAPDGQTSFARALSEATGVAVVAPKSDVASHTRCSQLGDRPAVSPVYFKYEEKKFRRIATFVPRAILVFAGVNAPDGVVQYRNGKKLSELQA